MKPRHLSLAGLVLAFAALPFASYSEVKVGLLLPKTSVLAVLGEEIDDGFVFALEEAGRLDEFEIVREDTELKPPVGLAKARKLVLDDEVDVIVGLVSSGVLGAVRDFVHQSETPLVVANAGNIHATGKDCSPYISRISFSNAQVNRPMGEFLANDGIKTVYTLAADYAAGHQMIQAFADAFLANGGEVIGGEYTPFGRTEDFGPYLTTAQAADPDAIYVFYAGAEAIKFVKQYGSFGIAEEIPLYGSGFLTSPLYVAAEGDAAVGVKTSLHYVPTLETEENMSFVEAFSERFEKAPSEYAVQGYDAARVLLEAVDSGAMDRESLAEALPKVSYTGPRGPLKIDPATNNVVQNIYVYETVKEGDGLTQKIVGTFEDVQDEPNGCEL